MHSKWCCNSVSSVPCCQSSFVCYYCFLALEPSTQFNNVFFDLPHLIMWNANGRSRHECVSTTETLNCVLWRCIPWLNCDAPTCNIWIWNMGCLILRHNNVETQGCLFRVFFFPYWGWAGKNNIQCVSHYLQNYLSSQSGICLKTNGVIQWYKCMENIWAVLSIVY